MTRRSRLILSAFAIAASALTVAMLTLVSSASEGPLSAMLDRAGAALGSLEFGVRRHVTTSSRSRELAWFAPYRASLDRLRRPDAVLLGAYDNQVPETLEGVVSLERSLGTTLPLIQLYSAWGDKPTERFPLQLATSIWDMGSIPVITWEPWLTDFENARHPALPLRDRRDRHGLTAVADGAYDFYVDQWAADAKRFGRPLFVRLAHEMNDPYRYPWGPQNNTKEEFMAAWRHVVDRFRRAGAANVLWVWSPHLAYKYWETYYPGADYVDWVATGALNFGTVAYWSEWWTFDQLFGLKYEGANTFGKPIMISEFGSLAVGGERLRWYTDALTNLPQRYAGVRALLFFNVSNDQTVTYQQVDWAIASDPALAPAIAAALKPWAPSN